MKKMFFLIFSIFFSSIVYAYELPKMYIDGDVDKLTDKEIKENVIIKYNDGEEYYAKIKLQGSISIEYPKKNFNITFYDDKNYDNKKELDFGFGSYNKFTLKANYLDNLYIRNLVSNEIGFQINKKYNLFSDLDNYGYTKGKIIELYINNEYRGIYNLNTCKDVIFDLNSNDSKMVLSSRNIDFSFKKNDGLKYFDIEKGEDNKENSAAINRVVKFVNESNDKEFKKEFSKYFNLDSVLNYYCYMQVAQLYDNISNNFYMLSYDGIVWYLALYDLDLSWGQKVYRGDLYKPIEDMKINKKSSFWEKVERNFGNELSKRYFELREEIFTEENIINVFDSYKGFIDDDVINKEYERWEYKDLYNYKYINQHLNERFTYLDDFFKNLYEVNYVLSIIICSLVFLVIVFSISLFLKK